MIEILSCGPLITVQDHGRPGWLSQGLAQGGAADRLALAEAVALLGPGAGAGLEIPGAPLRLKLHVPTTIALTGAPMRAEADGRPLVWHAAHPLPAQTVLDLRPTGQGSYSYLHVDGGLSTEEVLGSRAAHRIAGIGDALQQGDTLPCKAGGGGAARRLDTAPTRFDGGELRLVPTPQTRLFSDEERARFCDTAFVRDPRGNRQGVRLASDGAGFATQGQLTLLSDFILPGDVQMTGDGVPYILGPECQTTGGYPRIGSVIAVDLPRALQAPPGATFRFRFVTVEEARGLMPARPVAVPLVRDPADVPNLLSMQLISGVVSAQSPEDMP
ncbi:biotin-dependent carboxyltransferase family protein [Jannaschia sp. 2305UL9-9]|uniref:5-oxoprolinase subunit C family protein n=1 Tax=Jannaschia sp. 2305UL9-9 TaxID=3121638 RepID=UPI0035294FF4